MTDMITNPPHYQCENATITIEPIELCEQCGFLLGNALKYLFRYQHKGKPLEDLKKAEYYLKRYLDTFSDLQVDHRVYDDEGLIFNAFKSKEFLKEWDIDVCTEDNIKTVLEWTQAKIYELEMAGKTEVADLDTLYQIKGKNPERAKEIDEQIARLKSYRNYNLREA